MYPNGTMAQLDYILEKKSGEIRLKIAAHIKPLILLVLIIELQHTKVKSVIEKVKHLKKTQ